MMLGALRPYEQMLQTAGPLALVGADGLRVPLDVARYLGSCDATDQRVVERCVGPVIDMGCGPGRFVHALAERGVSVLGVDLAATAVALTRARGGAALVRDVFGHLPAEGRWATALVIDGNIGIGGDVNRLLARLAELLAPEGTAIVETAANPDADYCLQARFANPDAPVGPVFPWSVVGANALAGHAARHGFYVADSWSVGARCFVVLDRTIDAHN